MIEAILMSLAVALPAGGEEFDCQRKLCSEMSSCEEAMYKFHHCGHKRLDRDHDGVPCESVCP